MGRYVRPTSAPLTSPDRWAWTRHAACQGEDLTLFYGPDNERQPDREERERDAKQYCAVCPVITRCRDDAIDRKDKWGVHGGLSPEELQAERRRRMRGTTPRRDTEARPSVVVCGCCGTTGAPGGTGPDGRVLVVLCYQRWHRAGRPERLPRVRQGAA